MDSIACIGHMSKDYVNLSDKDTKYSSVGGCALFAAIYAVKIGLKSFIISKIGKDINDFNLGVITNPLFEFDTDNFTLIFPKSLDDIKSFSSNNSNLLNLEGINFIDSPSTSIYIFQEIIGLKTLSKAFLLELCPKITDKDIEDSKILSSPNTAYLLCPMIDEVDYSVAETIKKHSPSSLISIDGQGNVRKVDKNNLEYYGKWEDINKFAKFVDIIKLNEFEAQYAFGIDPVKEVNKSNWRKTLNVPIKRFIELAQTYNERLIYMITFGRDGMVIGFADKLLAYINVFKTEEIDPFGAGDSVHVAFIKKLLETDWKIKPTVDNFGILIDAAIYAAAAGSLAVTELGISEFLTSENIEYKIGTLRDNMYSIYKPQNF